MMGMVKRYFWAVWVPMGCSGLPIGKCLKTRRYEMVMGYIVIYFNFQLS